MPRAAPANGAHTSTRSSRKPARKKAARKRSVQTRAFLVMSGARTVLGIALLPESTRVGITSLGRNAIAPFVELQLWRGIPYACPPCFLMVTLLLPCTQTLESYRCVGGMFSAL